MNAGPNRAGWIGSVLSRHLPMTYDLVLVLRLGSLNLHIGSESGRGLAVSMEIKEGSYPR